MRPILLPAAWPASMAATLDVSSAHRRNAVVSCTPASTAIATHGFNPSESLCLKIVRYIGRDVLPISEPASRLGWDRKS